MSGISPAGGRASASRPLPARPNLEFERKRAKKRLRGMQRADPSAQLSDAQFDVAREYGFANWSRLVQYFTTLARHENSAAPPAWYPLEQFERQAAALVKQHASQRESAAVSLAVFVPRFYGMRPEDVVREPITIDDARLAVARSNRLATWDVLVQWVRDHPETSGWDRYESPRGRVTAAIRAGDLGALAQELDEHPELLRPVDRFGYKMGGGVLYDALRAEIVDDNPRARAIVEYLVSRGCNLGETLNQLLLHIIGFGHAGRGENNTRTTERLIARGAEPEWVAPNGYTVLEHMLVRNRTRTEIDMVLRYVEPRTAFWIAAALGDVKGMARYFNADGTLTDAARETRPDFTALGPFAYPQLPDASDIVLMSEAFWVATINGRYEAMGFLLDRGFPIDYSYFGRTMFWTGLNSRDPKLIAFLIGRGAKEDLAGATKEQVDQWLFEADPRDDNARRIYDLCGGSNYETVLRRYEAQQATAPTLTEPFLAAVSRARHDAARRGQAAITDENLFVALLSSERGFPLTVVGGFGVDIKALRASFSDRLETDETTVPDLPYAADAQETIDAVMQHRRQAHWRRVSTPDLLRALLEKDSGIVIETLKARGLRLSELRAEIAKW